MPPVSTISKDLPFQVALPYMRSLVMPGSSVTMDRRCPMIRLNSVDLPTLGLPTMAIRGGREFMTGSDKECGSGNADCGMRISDSGNRPQIRNPKSAFRNPKLVPLSFWKIAHQRLWDLKCLQVVYIRTTKTVTRFENPM